MSNILTIGYITEGSTDVRFLESIIERVFLEAAMDCKGSIEVFSPELIFSQGKNFQDRVLEAANTANNQGLMVLCVHADADYVSDKIARNERILPAFNMVKSTKRANICKNLVAIIPVQMTEAWMLADEDALLRAMISTEPLSMLGIENHPESYSDPKFKIKEAIRLAHQHRPKRHRQQVSIADVYAPVGQQCDLNKLRALPSFQLFEEDIREALRQLNYL
jgi:hypothetical protein